MIDHDDDVTPRAEPSPALRLAIVGSILVLTVVAATFRAYAGI